MLCLNCRHFDEQYAWDHDKEIMDLPKLDRSVVSRIVVCCTGTSPQPYKASVIDAAHSFALMRGFKTIGYHYMITSDGVVCATRPIGFRGSGLHGFDDTSVSVCYVGGVASSGAWKDTRTFPQRLSMEFVFGLIIREFPNIVEIVGRNDLFSCWPPCFNARSEYANFVSKFRKDCALCVNV